MPISQLEMPISQLETVMSQMQAAMQQAMNPFEPPLFRIEVNGNPTLASAVGALADSIHQLAEAMRMNALSDIVTQSVCQHSASMSVSHSDLLDAASAYVEGWKNIVGSIKTGDFQASTTGDSPTSTTGDFPK